MHSLSLSALGLFFAAVLAILLAVGEVFNKKVVEGQEVIAAVFWIRVFAVLEFSVILMVFCWKGSMPLIHPTAALEAQDLKDIPVLVYRLTHPANAAVEKILGSLSESTRRQLSDYESGAGNSALSKALISDFNGEHIIKGDLLYNAEDFAGVTLSEKVFRVLDRKPRGEGKSYANRLLLEDLFPGTIVGRQQCNLFGMEGVPVDPWMAFGVYLLIEVILVAASQFFTSYALKISPISLCAPFAAFAPIFLLGTGYVILSELPTKIQLLAICMIVIGGVMMQRKLFAVSWKAPIQAIVKERGSRYILLATLIGSVFGPIEKQLILLSDPLTTAFAYGLGTVIVFLCLCITRRADIMKVMRQKPGWAVLSGLADANTMFAQFIAVMYLPVVIVICIKRAGIVLTVVAGWLIFREQDITDRIIASLAMVGGIAIFYLPLTMAQAIVLMGVVIAGLIVALHLTRHSARG